MITSTSPGIPPLSRGSRGFDNYTYVLEAAVGGQGIAMGWRHFIERYLDSGALISLNDEAMKTNNSFCALVTEKGRQKTSRPQNALPFLSAASNAHSQNLRLERTLLSREIQINIL